MMQQPFSWKLVSFPAFHLFPVHPLGPARQDWHVQVLRYVVSPEARWTERLQRVTVACKQAWNREFPPKKRTSTEDLRTTLVRCKLSSKSRSALFGRHHPHRLPHPPKAITRRR